MQLSEKHVVYWQKNLRITAILMAIWFVVTYVVSYFAIELEGVTFLGFPIAFYMGAQGALIVYVVMIFVYARYMNKLDIATGVHEGEES